MRLPLTISNGTDVDAVDVLVKLVDHIRSDPDYAPDVRAGGIAACNQLIAVIKIKIGNANHTGKGRF